MTITDEKIDKTIAFYENTIELIALIRVMQEERRLKPIATDPTVEACMRESKDYYGLGGPTFEKFPGIGNRSMNVLPQLIGRKWDNNALAWVHTLRPSKIRVTTGEMYCDYCPWRVTVTVDENDVIQSIMQECSFGFIDQEHWRELQVDNIR